jgi:hypothetical protein
MAKMKVGIAGMGGPKQSVRVANQPTQSKATIGSPAIQKKIAAPFMEQAKVKASNKVGKVGAPRR